MLMEIICFFLFILVYGVVSIIGFVQLNRVSKQIVHGKSFCDPSSALEKEYRNLYYELDYKNDFTHLDSIIKNQTLQYLQKKQKMQIPVHTLEPHLEQAVKQSIHITRNGFFRYRWILFCLVFFLFFSLLVQLSLSVVFYFHDFAKGLFLQNSFSSGLQLFIEYFYHIPYHLNNGGLQLVSLILFYPFLNVNLFLGSNSLKPRIIAVIGILTVMIVAIFYFPESWDQFFLPLIPNASILAIFVLVYAATIGWIVKVHKDARNRIEELFKQETYCHSSMG